MNNRIAGGLHRDGSDFAVGSLREEYLCVAGGKVSVGRIEYDVAVENGAFYVAVRCEIQDGGIGQDMRCAFIVYGGFHAAGKID